MTKQQRRQREKELRAIQERDSNTQSRISAAYSALRNNDETTAQQILRDYMPANAGDDMHYALYQLEQVQFFEEEFLNPNQYRYGNSFLKFAESLIDAAYLRNPDETIKLLDWFKSIRVNTHDRLRLSESGLAMVYDSTFNGTEEAFESYCKQLVDGYKDKFELEHFLNFIGAALYISTGEQFSLEPFKSLCTSINNERLHQGRNLKKGLAIQWISSELSGRNKRIFDKAYITKLRNLGGHAGYTCVYRSEEIVGQLDKFKVGDASITFNNLKSLQMAVLLESSVKQFEYGPLKGCWVNMGFMDWVYTKEDQTLLIHQYFGNFSDKKRINSIQFYTPPIQGKEHTVSIAFNGNKVIPYDQRVIASKHTLKMLEEVYSQNEIRVVLMSVAPQVEPFTNFGQEPVPVMNAFMLPVNQHVEESVNVDKEILEKTIETLAKTL